MLDTGHIRRNFRHTGKRIYFNAASNGPFPDPACRICEDIYTTASEAAVGAQDEVFASLTSIRKNGARIFGCKASEVGFGFNTTFGLNLAAFGMPLKRGDEVLISNIDFPANVYPWLELRNRGIKVTLIESDGGFVTVDSVRRSMTKKTRAVALSLVQFFNGYRIDAAAIGRLCREHDSFFVLDAIQAAGCESIRMKKWGVDIGSAGGQKWLLSPQGTGLFYVSDEMQERLIPPWRSWLGIDWKCNWSNLRDYERQYGKNASQFELGTYPSAHVAAFEWSLDYINRLGVRNIQKHNHELLDLLIAYLKTEPAYRVTSSLTPRHRSSILSFTTTDRNASELYAFLTGRHIVTSLREGAIRISVHLYNNTADMQKLIAALRSYVAAHR